MSQVVTSAEEVFVKRYEPYRFMPTHKHTFDKVSFMLAGSVKEKRGTSETLAEAGWVVVKPADVLHEDEMGPNGLCTLTLVASPENDELRTTWIRLVSDYRWIPIDKCAGRLVRLWLDGIEPAGSVIEEVVLSLAAEIDRSSDVEQSAPWFQKALNMLQESYVEPPSLSELADIVAVHPVTLSKQFRAYGANKSELIHRIRIQRAMKDLSSDRSLTWIAEENGYSDSAHFTRSFKHWVGCTPTQFRKSFCSNG